MITLKKLSAIAAYMAIFLAILSTIGVLACGPGVRFDLWHFLTGIKLLKWSIYGGIAATILILLHTLLEKINGQQIFRPYAILTFLTGLAIFAIPYAYIYEFNKYNTIADATTDYENPPVFINIAPLREKTAKNPLEYRGDEAAEQQRLYFPNLTGLKIKAQSEHTLAAASDVLIEMGLDIIAVAPDESRLEATDTTFWFGYKDDMVVRIRDLGNGYSLVDARSASRVGYGDGGVNAKRIQTFLHKLEQRLLL